MQNIADWLQDKAVMTRLLRQHLNRAQQRMKFQADKKRSDRQFEPGDWVFFKLQPYVQTSVATRANHKLAFRYYGPFQVEKRVGEIHTSSSFQPRPKFIR